MISLPKKINNIEFESRFRHIEVENLVEKNLFENLREKFPNEEYFSEHNDFAKSLDDENEKFQSFLETCEEWKEFINKLNTNQFFKDLKKIFKLKNVYYNDSDLKRFIPSYKKVKLSFCFNISKQGGFSLPHTDSSRKLVSLVYFFVSDEWNINNGGEVNLYKPIKPEHEENWRNVRIHKDNLEKLKTIIPVPNKIYGFKKSKNSYHSVEPVKEIGGLVRKVFMINLIYDKKSDSPYYEKKNMLEKIKNIF